MEQKTKLLLAEDDENLGLLLKEYLIAKGYDTDLYSDGEVAYHGFMRNHYHLCLLDVMMPGVDGFEACRNISSHTKTRNIPIILFSFAASTLLAYLLATFAPIKAEILVMIKGNNKVPPTIIWTTAPTKAINAIMNTLVPTPVLRSYPNLIVNNASKLSPPPAPK